jgi:hypothetical protein
MNDQGRISAPVKNAIYGFFLVTLAMFAIGHLRKASLIEENTARRALGVSIGILMLVVGNYLPKTRFLKTLRWTASWATAAERLTGWAFVLTGAVDVCAFVMTPLSLARTLSSCLGAIVVLAIFVTGLSLWTKSRSATRSSDPEEETEPQTGQQRKGCLCSLL